MKANKWLLVLIILSFIGTLIVYSYLPDIIPRHWNYNGEVDGYMNKWGVIALGLLPLGIYLLLLVVPKIDPKRKSFLMHKKGYEILKVSIIILIIIMHWLTILIALEFSINISVITKILVGLLFIIIGNYMSQIRPNYMYGIRTPWTLANEKVWKKTHRVGGYGFMIGGGIFIVDIFINNTFSFTISLGYLLLLVVGLFLYSYMEYEKINKDK